jgi:hypothetical protein
LDKYDLSASSVGLESYARGVLSHLVGVSAGEQTAEKCVGPAVVCLCAEHTLESDGHTRYWRNRATGDARSGRLAAGLRERWPDFAVLPPHFLAKHAADRELIRRAAQCAFPVARYLPAHTNEVLEYCLASVLHHLPALQATLPPDHQVRFSTLFSGQVGREVNLDHLHRLLCVDVCSARPGLTASGVPELVRQAGQLSAAQLALDRHQAALALLPTQLSVEVTQRVHRLLHSHASPHDNATPLREALLGDFTTELRAHLEQRLAAPPPPHLALCASAAHPAISSASSVASLAPLATTSRSSLSASVPASTSLSAATTTVTTPSTTRSSFSSSTALTSTRSTSSLPASFAPSTVSTPATTSTADAAATAAASSSSCKAGAFLSGASALSSAAAMGAQELASASASFVPVVPGLFQWPDKEIRQLPNDFRLPSVPLKNAWRLWLLGMPAQGVVPFMQLHPTDFSLTAQRKALSDWRVPLAEMERLGRELTPQLWADYERCPRTQTADLLFDSVVPHMPRRENLLLSRYLVSLSHNKISTIAKNIRRIRHDSPAQARRVRPRISSLK